MTLYDLSHPHLLISVSLGKPQADTAGASLATQPGPTHESGRAWLRIFVDAAAVDSTPDTDDTTPWWGIADVTLAGASDLAPGNARDGSPVTPRARFASLGLALDWLDAMVFSPRGMALDRDAIASRVAGLCWQLES